MQFNLDARVFWAIVAIAVIAVGYLFIRSARTAPPQEVNPITGQPASAPKETPPGMTPDVRPPGR